MSDEQKANARGRPTKFRKEYADTAALCAARGFTHPEICQVLGIVRDTFWRWRTRHPAFEKALQIPILKANERVKRSLYERAVGHTRITEQVVLEKTSKDTTEARTIQVAISEPPETAAISLWLRNRDPKNWRDKVDIESFGNVTYLFDDPTKRPEGYQRKPKPPAPT
jgi:hypothetical protein